MVYQQISDEHLMVCHELERRYEERLAARYVEKEVGMALQADRTVFLWTSEIGD